MTKYICNLVIPGAAKSGTSSLHEALSRHPDICMSSKKEPHHFCLVERYAGGAISHNQLFAASTKAQVFGESSTGYLIWPDAIQRIQNDLHRPKIIMILREPVQRTFSHYRWRYRLGLERRTFMSALTEDGEGFDPEKPKTFGYTSYLQFSRYAKYCPMWVSAFGEENCLIVRSEDFKSDAGGLLARCHEFLGVQAIRTAETFHTNSTESLGVRPPNLLTRAASVFPLSVRSSGLYLKCRETLLRGVAKEPPAKMTEEEATFLRSTLHADIDYFHKLESQ